MKNKEGLKDNIHRLVAECLHLVEALGSSEEGFALAQWTVNFLIQNPCGIYRCDALELSLLPSDADRVPVASTERQGDVLHVLSEPYQHGGHTRVAKHLLACAGQGHDVLLTRVPEHPDSHTWLGKPSSQVYFLKAEGHMARMRALATRMAAYRELYLYLHPDDLVGGVAVQWARRLNPDLRVGFFNHADHSFSVAIGAADQVFEISTYGWQLRRARGIEDRASFVGIPIAAPEGNAVVADGGTPSEKPHAFSAGAAYKYKPSGDVSLPDILDRLLSVEDDLVLDLAGPREIDEWWQSARSRHGMRVQFHGLLPHARYLQMMRDSAIFIDSYPRTGGMAFPEALLAGGSVVGLSGGTWGFSLADALRLPDPDSFIQRCRALLRGDSDAIAEQHAVRKACAEFHAPDAVWARMRATMDRGVLLEPPVDLIRSGMPPLLAEHEWFAIGEIRMPLPDRRGVRAALIHKTIGRIHAGVFGPLHPTTVRLWITWLVRHAGRSR